jgi:hypothetical protein
VQKEVDAFLLHADRDLRSVNPACGREYVQFLFSPMVQFPFHQHFHLTFRTPKFQDSTILYHIDY